ncbi:MAG: 4-hydroxythreonine-4-phosphate dehydrogenase PdxA [Tannerella sp.]|jgi:4-hydroxythreonine-4-phosphate dehydrogenase|nr:4-hydroxythreonine-4-phosphate dehydrogenase PdxA [Tannerella sp.]
MDIKCIKIGITHGDMNGIGYEVILKTLADERLMEFCTPILFGSQKLALYYQKVLDLPPLNYKTINRAEEAVEGKINLINCVDENLKIDFGRSTPEAGMAARKALEAASASLKRGVIQAMVTAPINKSNIQRNDFHFPGHTEYLEKVFEEGGKPQSIMIMTSEAFRIAFVTVHIPLNEVKARLTQEAIVDKLTLFHTSLIQDFGVIKPCIAVLALNPHAGDQGLLGTEEESVIAPAIALAEKNGITAFGPFPADGFFGTHAYQKFDGVLAMYHDQGLIPFKLLTMGSGVNYTGGLPVVRTSPVHGTAYDISGRNMASEASFRNALYVAIDIYRKRKNYREITANTLRKHYFDKSGDNVKLDLTAEEPNE